MLFAFINSVRDNNMLAEKRLFAIQLIFAVYVAVLNQKISQKGSSLFLWSGARKCLLMVIW